MGIKEEETGGTRDLARDRRLPRHTTYQSGWPGVNSFLFGRTLSTLRRTARAWIQRKKEELVRAEMQRGAMMLALVAARPLQGSH